MGQKKTFKTNKKFQSFHVWILYMKNLNICKENSNNLMEDRRLYENIFFVRKL